MRSVPVMRSALVVVLVACLATLTACGSSKSGSSSDAIPTSTVPTGSATALSLIGSTQGLDTFASVLKASSVSDKLAGSTPITVLAPTDLAFKDLPKGVEAKLLLPCNQATLDKIVLYHVIPENLPADVIKPGKVPTLEGSTVTITTGGGRVLINNTGGIYTNDIAASNGTVKNITAVLVPPDVKLSSLASSC